MGADILIFLKKTILPSMFMVALSMFFFDFITLSMGDTKAKLTGFNLFNNTSIEPSIWMILVFVLGVVCFIISWLNEKIKYGIGFLLALAEIILLLVAQFSMRDHLNGMDRTITNIVFEPAYWMCIIAFALGGSGCYLLQNRNTQRKEKQARRDVVNINIITQTYKTNEK